MAVVQINWTVDELASVLALFDVHKVYRSTTGQSGPYTELTTPATRVPLVIGQTSYSYDDLTGDNDYWYKVSYYNSTTLLESQASDPIPATGAGEEQGISIRGLGEIELAAPTAIVNGSVTTVRIYLRTVTAIAGVENFITNNGLVPMIVSQAGLAEGTTFSAYTSVSSTSLGEYEYYVVDATVSS